jgi:small subunit ribosomal protein S4e
MAKKHGSIKQKGLSVSKVRFMPRKSRVWVLSSKPGTHSKALSIPLGFLLTDLLEVTKNSREAGFLLNNGKVLVDGIERKSRNFSIGLFDLVELKDLKKNYRIVLDCNGRLVPAEIKDTGKQFKLCRISRKKTVKGAKILLSTLDGRNFSEKQTSLKPGDSIKVGIPEQKIIEELPLQEGSIVLLLSGKHVGKTAKVLEITQGSLRKDKLLTLEDERKKFQTVEKSVFVIGKQKPEIELFKEE